MKPLDSRPNLSFSLSLLTDVHPRSFSTFQPTCCQTCVDVLQPIIELPVYPLPPLSLSTMPPPPRPLSNSTSLLCLSTDITDAVPSSVNPTSSSSFPSLVPPLPSYPPFFSSSFSFSPPSSQSPTATLQSTNTQTQSSSSSSGDGRLFSQRGSQAAQPDETGRVPPYVDFSQFYRLWGSDHCDGQSTQGGLGPQ